MRALLTEHRKRRTGAVVAGAAVAAVAVAAGPMVMARADDQSDAGRQGGGPRGFSARVITGVQIYTCAKGAFAPPSTPEAQLEKGIHHFGGPRWQAPDGSMVLGHVEHSTPRPNAIPELELSATSIGGPGLLAHVHVIRRLNTEGGLPPTGSCTDGVQVRVPYRATYVFQQH